MKVTKKVIFLTLIEMVCIFVCFTIFGLIYYKAPDLEISSAATYKFCSACLLYFRFLPSIIASGIIVGYAWSFGRNKVIIEHRFSSVAGKYLVHIVIMALCATLICFVAKEIARPLIENSQKRVTVKSQNIKEYLSLANNDFEKGEYGTALFYTKSALELNKKHKEANELLIKVESKLSDEQIIQIESNGKHKAVSSTKYDNTTIPGLMKHAIDCFENEDYINAHYYASLVMNLSKENDGNRIRARQIITESWTKLEDTKAFDNELSKKVYLEKKEAYEALSNGDYSKAYYSYADLLRRYPRDNDIQTYYEQSKIMLSSQCFFTDETEDLQQFEQYNNIHFKVRTPDGGNDIISIAGLTSTKGTEKMICYLRNFSVISFDKDNNLKYKMTVPYAKMISVPVENVNSDMQEFIKLNFKTDLIPYIYLNSVDRKFENAFVKPVYECYNGFKPEFDSIYVLPVSLEKFGNLCDISNGEENMGLMELLKFSDDCYKYGYSRELLSYILIKRIAYPFLLFYLFIMCGVFAWQYRLFLKDSFKTIWLAVFPLLITALHMFTAFVSYFMGLMVYTFIGAVGPYAIFLSMGVLIFLILTAGFRFAAVRR